MISTVNLTQPKKHARDQLINHNNPLILATFSLQLFFFLTFVWHNSEYSPIQLLQSHHLWSLTDSSVSPPDQSRWCFKFHVYDDNHISKRSWQHQPHNNITDLLKANDSYRSKSTPFIYKPPPNHLQSFHGRARDPLRTRDLSGPYPFSSSLIFKTHFPLSLFLFLALNFHSLSEEGWKEEIKTGIVKPPPAIHIDRHCNQGNLCFG